MRVNSIETESLTLNKEMLKSNGCHGSGGRTILIPMLVLAVIIWTSVGANGYYVTPQSPDSGLIDNTIDGPEYVACGTIVTNTTLAMIKNPHHPKSTFTKTICETVIERIDPSISKLKVNFKQLELYRPNMDGQCIHDRFSVYTDLNAPVTPVICGNQTGKIISVPFVEPLKSLIVSVTTSDLDHDRVWTIEISQEK